MASHPAANLPRFDPAPGPPRPLPGARARLSRAIRHIESLHGALAAFLTPGCFRACIEPDRLTGRNRMRASLVHAVPAGIPGIIGDVVHNARVALDTALAEMVRARIGYIPRHLRFPFHATREGVARACRSGELAALGPDAARIILDDIRPFRGGDEQLCALHDLDIRSRHQPLVPQINIVELRNLQVEDPSGLVRLRLTVLLDHFGHASKPLLALAGPLRLLDPGAATFAVLLPEAASGGIAPLMPVLVQFTRRVAAAIDRLEHTEHSPIR